MKYFLILLLTPVYLSSMCQNNLSDVEWITIQNYRNADQKLSTEEKEVISTIRNLFDGMRAGDSSRVSTTFYGDIITYTQYTDKEGVSHLKEGSVQEFLNAIGTPHEEMWNEKLSHFDIKIDKDLAQIWTDYFFFVDENFHHAGTNFFQLYRTSDGWKIFHLSDTRRRINAQEVPAINDLW